jgi:histidine triad (HIT) family protein
VGEKADTGDCLFCRIAAGEMETETIIEDDEFIAIWDKYPKASVHALVIPRRHIAWLNDIGDVAAGGDEGFSQRMLDFVVRTAEKLEVADTGYRVINNVGSGGGQVIFHLHWHILAGGDRGFNIKEQL